MRVFFHTRRLGQAMVDPDFNTVYEFSEVPRAGENIYIRKGGQPSVHQVRLVEWLTFGEDPDFKADFEAEIWAVELDPRDHLHGALNG